MRTQYITVDLDVIITGALTHTRKVTPVVEDSESSSKQMLERGFNWMGSIVGTGLPNLLTHAMIGGGGHDKNVLTAKVPTLDGGTVSLARALDKGGEISIADPEVLCGLVQAGTTAFQYDWSSAQDSRFPSFLFRTTPIFSLAYGAHPLTTPGADGYNYRPFLSFTAGGGSRYLCQTPANPTAFPPNSPESWGSSLMTSSDLVTAHAESYGEARYGCLSDYGINVSQKSKNHVIGDTGSTPSGDRYAYGYAYPEYSDDMGRVATYDSKIGRYFHAGDLAGEQRKDSDAGGDIGYLNYYNPYSMAWRQWADAEDGWDYFGAYISSIGSFFSISGIRGIAAWIDDNTSTWSIPSPFGGTIMSSSFADNRVRNTIIAEFASPGREQDCNIISHAGLAACVWNNSVPDAATLNNQYGSLYLSNLSQWTTPVVFRALTLVDRMIENFCECAALWSVYDCDTLINDTYDKWMFRRGADAKMRSVDPAQANARDGGVALIAGLSRGEACVPDCGSLHSGLLIYSRRQWYMELGEGRSGYLFPMARPCARLGTSAHVIKSGVTDFIAGKTLNPWINWGVNVEPRWKQLNLPSVVSHRSWGSSTLPLQTKCEDKHDKLQFTRAHASRRKSDLLSCLGLYNEFVTGTSELSADWYDIIGAANRTWDINGTVFRFNNFIQTTQSSSHFWELSGQVPGIWIGKVLFSHMAAGYMEGYAASDLVLYTFGAHLAVGIQIGGKL